MNIQNVIQNLKNTIAGKQLLLDEYKKSTHESNMMENVMIGHQMEYLRINIGELNRILQDLESCLSSIVE